VLSLDVPAPAPERSREQWCERFAQVRTQLGKTR